MSKKLISGMILAYLAQIYLPPPLKKKINKQKSWVLRLLDVRNCRKLSPYAISRKTSDANLAKKIAKNFILDLIFIRWAQIRAGISFLKNLALSVCKYHGQLSSRTISEKIIYPILRNLVTERRTDRQTDRKTAERQTDRREWFHSTLFD